MTTFEPERTYSPAIAAIRERILNDGSSTTSTRLMAAPRPRESLNETIANILRLRTGEPFPPRPPAARLVVNNDRRS
jgi:hypothetical protein